MRYGYARVSTAAQMRNGNSLDDQEARLREAGADVVAREAYTGTKLDRPEFDALVDKLVPGDEIIITKLDRFARTAAEGSALVQQLVNQGVVVNILNMGKADNSCLGKLMVTILLAFAEYERDMIVERTQTGKAIARSKGIKVDGRPKKYSPVQMNHAIELLDEGNSYTQVENWTGISKSTLIRARREKRAACLHQA